MEESDGVNNTSIDTLSNSIQSCEITQNHDDPETTPDYDDDEIINQFIDNDDKYFSVRRKDGRIEEKVCFDEVPRNIIFAYYTKIAQENFVDSKMKFSFLFNKASQGSIELNRVLNKFQTPRGLKLPPSKKKQIEEKLAELADYAVEDTNYETRLLELGELYCIENILQTRRSQLISLQKRIYCWNLISDNKLPMQVVNEYDLEVLPDLKYINASEFVANRNLDKKTQAEGCKCVADCSPGCSCISLNVVTSYENGKLSEKFMKTKNNYSFPYPIYECNKRCGCPKTCPYKVVQNGSDIPFVLSRMFNGCGWGVRTAEDIETGTFVIRYVGEIISSDQANERDCTAYQFALYYQEKDQKNCDFVIDPQDFGNVSRFFNHSCQPNLGIVSAFTNYHDKSLHEISFFALHYIKKGDELTINYGPNYVLQCLCNRKNCQSKDITNESN